MISNRCSLGQQSGFTLLELLVALVVLGFLVVGLTQGIRTGLAMWGAQTRRLSETAELDAGARVLRKLLTNMTALSPGNVGTGAATPNAAIPNIGASSDKLTFVGDLPTGLGTTRRANITLELNQERLVLRWTPRRHERTTAPEPEPIETELIRGVERLEFAYWGAASPDQPASWQDQWGSPQFPELIRVRLTFSKGDRRRWPNLIVAPSASASPGQLQRQRRPGELKAGSSYQRWKHLAHGRVVQDWRPGRSAPRIRRVDLCRSPGCPGMPDREAPAASSAAAPGTAARPHLVRAPPRRAHRDRRQPCYASIDDQKFL